MLHKCYICATCVLRSHIQAPDGQFGSLEGLLGPDGSIWDAFGSLLDHFWVAFWRLVVLVRIDTPLKRKPTFEVLGDRFSALFVTL